MKSSYAALAGLGRVMLSLSKEMLSLSKEKETSGGEMQSWGEEMVFWGSPQIIPNKHQNDAYKLFLFCLFFLKKYKRSLDYA